MKKTSKIIVCALFIPAGPAFAVTAVSVIPEAYSIPVTSPMAEKLSETAAGLSAAEAGDNAKAEALLARLYSGGALKESAVPVYAAALMPARADAPAVSTAQAAAAPEVQVAYLSDAEIAARDEVLTAAKAKKDAEDAADKKKEDAAKLKTFKSGVGMMLLALLLIMLLL